MVWFVKPFFPQLVRAHVITYFKRRAVERHRGCTSKPAAVKAAAHTVAGTTRKGELRRV